MSDVLFHNYPLTKLDNNIWYLDELDFYLITDISLEPYPFIHEHLIFIVLLMNKIHDEYQQTLNLLFIQAPERDYPRTQIVIRDIDYSTKLLMRKCKSTSDYWKYFYIPTTELNTMVTKNKLLFLPIGIDDNE